MQNQNQTLLFHQLNVKFRKCRSHKTAYSIKRLNTNLENLPFALLRLFQISFGIVVGKDLYPVAFEFESGVKSICNLRLSLGPLESYCCRKERYDLVAGLIEKYKLRTRKVVVGEDRLDLKNCSSLLYYTGRVIL